MKRLIILIILVIMNMQLAFAESNEPAGMIKAVIRDSNNEKDLGSTVVVHLTNLNGRPYFVCDIFDQDGQKVRTVR